MKSEMKSKKNSWNSCTEV